MHRLANIIAGRRTTRAIARAVVISSLAVFTAIVVGSVFCH
jgi:hypothetical protein